MPTWVALSDAGVQNRRNQIMQNWFRRKELVSPPYDKCGIFAKQDLEFHAGDLIGSEHRPECLKCETCKLGASRKPEVTRLRRKLVLWFYERLAGDSWRD